jgi:hypothetical protein
LTSPRIQFHRHDVTTTPFPVSPADLLYGRFLVTHLGDPSVLFARWATQLRPGGLLIVEDANDIDTDHSTLRAYLEVVAALLAHQGNQLYVGRSLHELADPTGLRRERSEVPRLPVATAQAATMFWMNLQTWKADPFVVSQFGPVHIARIESELATLMAVTGGRSDIEWEVRQLVYRRAPPSDA